MTEEMKSAAVMSFRSPRSSEWKSLEGEEGNEESKRLAQQNQEELRNILLSSLQMQHLVVLAGSGCSMEAGGPSMSDLWNKIIEKTPSDDAKKAVESVGHDINNKNIEVLLSRIEAMLALNEEKALRTFLNNSKSKILKRCSEFLDNDEKLEAHKTFIHRLSRRRSRDQRLKIFTTNYDLCFERAASMLGEEVSPKPDEACMIYPAAGKYQQSFRQPHLEFIAQYLAAVREPNSCIIVVGFGFNDDHLSAPLLSAVSSNPHLRLIVVDPSLQKNLTSENDHWRRLGELSAQGEDVWLISASFGYFAQLIPDLKSLSPADALAKAIQGIARAT